MAITSALLSSDSDGIISSRILLLSSTRMVVMGMVVLKITWELCLRYETPPTGLNFTPLQSTVGPRAVT
jgi:hypothetical protein